MPTALNHLTAALPTAAVAALLVAAPASATPCRAADAMPTTATLGQARHATLCLLNQQRALHGLRPVRPNAELRRAAQAYSRTMVRHEFFAHVSPGGSTLLRRVRKTPYLSRPFGWMLGENLAWGSGRLATPRRTMRAWMHSSHHRRNILTARFTEIGIGIALGAPVHWSVGMPAATYTTDFGKR
jgi:uncharacterized protein YkwD